MTPQAAVQALPRALSDYADPAGASLLQVLVERARAEPFNAIATAIFAAAILHTFFAARIQGWAASTQKRHDERCRLRGESPAPSVLAESLQFFGEVEVVFGLWAIALLVAMTSYAGWGATTHYFNDTVNYTEPVFVVVIMAMAATRPIVMLAESAVRQIARIGGGTAWAWWTSILLIGPILGSFITEPAAMTICALLLGRQFYSRNPSTRLKYATLGLLFVNVSIGGTLTSFAAPPVLIVARAWSWDTAFVLNEFGWRAVTAVAVSTIAYLLIFSRELRTLGERQGQADSSGASAGRIPAWVTMTHVAFMAFAVFTGHEPALFVGAFMFFLGFTRATSEYQDTMDLKSPLLVGFFLAGLVIHGGLQGWWIAPILSRLAETPLFVTAAALTAFNDNALITYLATLVPDLDLSLRTAVVGGAVVGGGLTVIANAPNPAGQALVGRYFDNGISPLRLLAAALPPTIVAAIIFHWL
jgi:hypothetical protein